MPDTPQPPKRKRRWLSFSLRTLLVVVTIICVVLAYWVHRANRQKAVVKWVEENGGWVAYDFEIDEKGEPIDDGKPPGPGWVHAALANDYLCTVIYVDLLGSELKDLAPLAKLEQLEFLNLHQTQAADLTPLEGLKKLEWLSLGYMPVNDLTPLTGLTSLTDLYLDDLQVNDLTPLAGLSSLEVLSLGNTQVSDLTPLVGLTSLKFLYLENTQLSDLTPLTGLTSLGCSGISLQRVRSNA